jgi:hypothetical protein
MNTRRVAIVLWLFVAFVVGYVLGIRLELAGYMHRAFRGVSDQQYYATMLSIAGLERLERGDIDGAKRLLSTNVSSYYRYPVGDTDPRRQAQIREQIEKTSEHSPLLKEMLAKPTK